MGNALFGLIGAQINSIERIYDYWQISTDKGMISVYSQVRYCKNKNVISHENHLDRDKIINRYIVNITFHEQQYFFIELDDRSLIVISLADSERFGPEALTIHLDSGEIIVS